MKNSRPVYSTESGPVGLPDPGAPWSKSQSVRELDDGTVRIFRERGGRGGKTVTIVRGLRERGEGLANLAAELKRMCGAGGTVKDGVVEIQGDHRERVADRLRALGHRVKFAGG